MVIFGWLRMDTRDKTFLILPYSQVILGCLHEFKDITAISTETPKQWWVLSYSIPHLNVIWSIKYILANNVQWGKWNIDIHSFGHRDEVNASCHGWVFFSVWWWRKETIWCVEIASTFSTGFAHVLWFITSIIAFCVIITNPMPRNRLWGAVVTLEVTLFAILRCWSV